MDSILELDKVDVFVNQKNILKELDLKIRKNSVYALFGPNGSGKTTLMHAVMGYPGYEVRSGRIFFEGEEIGSESLDERARRGIAISFQNPPRIRGVTLRDMINICLKKTGEEIKGDALDIVKRFKLEDFLDRDINDGFSGGEKKRAEILQLMLMRPKLLLLDEPDSGVDIESIKLISREIGYYIRQNNASALIITHQGHMLEYITTREACVMLQGKIHCFMEPDKILKDIKEKGYEGCLQCLKNA